MSPGNVVAQQGRRLVHVHHQYVHVAIIVEIAEGTAATRVRRADPGARLLNQFLKPPVAQIAERSEEHTSELQSLTNLVCRLLLEKKKNKTDYTNSMQSTKSSTSTIPGLTRAQILGTKALIRSP